MSPLKSAAVFVLAAIQAASAAWIDSKTQALLGLQMVSTPAVATLGTWPDSGLQSRLELAQPRVQTSPSATAVSSNGVVYSATALVDVQQLVTGWDANGTPFACYGNRAFDGSFSISADGTNTPLISDAQLPGGQTLANSGYVEMGCARNAGGVTTVYFMAVDPNHKLSTGQPFLSLWYADSSGNSGQLIGAGSTLTAKDPRTGQDTTYTVTQVSPSLEVRGGKATVLLVATPPQQSTAVPPVPQGLFVQIGTSGQPTVLFNNLKDQNSNFWFSSIAGFLQSEGNLWILGQSVAPPNAPTKTALGLFRVQNGQPTLIKNYFEPVGSVANSWKDGVQVYALDSTGVAKVYSFVPDNALPFGGFGSNGEVVLFSGTRIDDVVLSSRDWQIPTGEKELYVITSGDNSLLKVGSGTARLIHTPQMSPTGTARGVALSANQVLYVQNEGSVNRTYLMYILPTALPLVQALPGDTVTVDGSALIIDNRLPSFTLLISGRQVAYGATSSGKITIDIPSYAAPGNYTGTFDVAGVKISQPIQVQTPGQAAPVITSVLNGATFQGSSLAPREHISIFLSKAATGSPASLTSYPTYELGGMSAQLDGTPMPLIYNSGSGQINAILPKSAAGKSEGNVTVSIKYTGGTATSQPFKVNLGPVDDSFFQFPDADGKTLPILTHANGALVSKASPASVGETLVGYGTGCAPSPASLPDDGQLNPASIPSAVTPSLLVGGQAAQVTYAGLVQGFVGLCQYNFVIPASAGSGDISMQFAGTAYLYTLRAK